VFEWTLTWVLLGHNDEEDGVDAHGHAKGEVEKHLRAQVYGRSPGVHQTYIVLDYIVLDYIVLDWIGLDYIVLD